MLELRVGNVFVDIIGDLKTSQWQEIEKQLSFRPQGFNFSPLYNRWIYRTDKDGKKVKVKRIWDGWKRQAWKNKNRTYFPTGLYSIVASYLKEENIPFRARDLRVKPEQNIVFTLSDDFIERDYQTKVCDDAANQQRGIIQAATGSGKCIRYDSLVITDSGILTFEELIDKELPECDLDIGEYHKHKSVISTPDSEDGTDVSSYIYYDGVVKSIKVTTQSGFEICGTPSHRIKVLTSNGQQWRCLKDIAKDDFCVICKNQMMFGKDVSLTRSDGYWIGLLIGDGCLTSKVTVRLTNEDEHIIRFAETYCKERGLRLHNRSHKTSDKCRELFIHNKRYREELYDLGCDYSLSINKEVPILIRQSREEVVASFLRGLFESDGWVEKHAVCLATSSERLSVQVQVMLLNFGIVSTRHVRQTSCHPSYHISVYRDYIPIFVQRIGLDANGHKYRKLNQTMKEMSPQPNSNLDVIPHQSQFIKNNICSDQFHYDAVATTTDDMSRNYDFVVPDSQSFSAQGFVNHNTAICAALIKRLQVSPFLFFVTSIDLAHQARTELQKFLRINSMPFTVGQIGGGVIEFGDVNVLTVQTVVRVLGKQWNAKTRFDNDDADDPTPIQKHRDEILELLHEAKGAICDECISGNSLIVTKNGPVKMKDLSNFIGKKILSLSGNSVVWKKITHFYPKGKKETLTVVLLNGNTITCTNDHPIMTKTGWKLSKQLSQEDAILCCANTGAGDTNYVEIESISRTGEEEVFDITVEDTQCFFANNILVHNCQHWRADTCQLVTRNLPSCYYIYGMSATPYRDEGDDLMIQACFGKKVAEITASELITTIDPTTGNSFLMKPYIKMVHLREKKTLYRQWQSIYKDQVVENEFYNNAIANIANAYIEQGRLLLILVTQVKHGKYLEMMVPGGHFLSGNSPKKKRIEAIDKLRNKDIKCIISTVIFDEGINVKPLDTLLLAGQGKSKVRAMQRIGRVLRPCEGKPNPTVIDFHLHQTYLDVHAKSRAKMYETEPEFDIEHIDPDPKRIFTS